MRSSLRDFGGVNPSASSKTANRVAILVLFTSCFLTDIVSGKSSNEFTRSEEFDWFSCDGKNSPWTPFKKAVNGLLRSGIREPTDIPDGIVEMAEYLISPDTTAMPLISPNQNAYMGYSGGMEAVLNSCNQQIASTKQNFCLYGVVSALWIVGIRRWHTMGAQAGEQLLTHARYLLGSHTRHCLDFMESSDWLLSSLDLLVQNTESIFRSPLTMPPHIVPARHIKMDHDVYTRPIPVIWEIGVHASLSAEPLNLWAHSILGKFKFANLITEQYPPWLPDKWSTLYAENFDDPAGVFSYQDTSQSALTLQALFREWIPQSAHSKDPVMSIDELDLQLRAVVRSFAQQEALTDLPDLILCTVFVLCSAWIGILEELGRNQIGLVGFFGHPMLFMVEDKTEKIFEKFNKVFDMGVMAVSDPFLQMQYEYQTGKVLPDIRQHAAYLSSSTTWSPRGERQEDVLVVDRPHECILICLIQYFIDRTSLDEVHGGNAVGPNGTVLDGKPGKVTGSSAVKKTGDKVPDGCNADPKQCNACCARKFKVRNYAGKKIGAEGRLRMAKWNMMSPEKVGQKNTVTKVEASPPARKPPVRKPLDPKVEAAILEKCGTGVIKEPPPVEEDDSEDSDEDNESYANMDYTEYIKAKAAAKRKKNAAKNAAQRKAQIEYQRCANAEKKKHEPARDAEGSEPSTSGPDENSPGQIVESVYSSPQYPLQFITRQLTHTRSFEEFSQFRSVVLFPYDMDLITFYEYYQLCMPLFLPKHLSKYMFSQDHLEYDVRYHDGFHEEGDQTPNTFYKFLDDYDGYATKKRDKLWGQGRVLNGLSPFQEDSVDAVFEILKFTDYFRYPGVQYFSSIKELVYGLIRPSSNWNTLEKLEKISKVMRRFNQKSMIQSVGRWEQILNHVWGPDRYVTFRQDTY